MKAVSSEPKKYVLSKEKDVTNPTVFHIKPLNRAQLASVGDLLNENTRSEALVQAVFFGLDEITNLEGIKDGDKPVREMLEHISLVDIMEVGTEIINISNLSSDEKENLS